MIVLDIETSGLDPDRHSIVSLGAVELEQPENQFYEECRVWEGAEIMQAALDVCGFTRDEVTDSDKQSPEEMMRNFLDWARGCDQQTIAGHNVHFDLAFLNDMVKQYGLEDFFHKRTVDTHSITWMQMVKEGKETPVKGKHSAIDSDFVFEYAGINHTRDTHNALEDAKLTAEAISRLLYDQKLFAEFS